MPKMICLCGMPGVGKTTWAKRFLRKYKNYKYFCPDGYYKKFNGDERDRSNTFYIWHNLFADVQNAFENNQNVLIDSDNLTFHQRMQWVEWFPGFERYLIYFENDFEECFKRVSNRKRTIPRTIMEKKYIKWENPRKTNDNKYWTIIRCKKKGE